jgi:hypothetical protein
MRSGEIDGKDHIQNRQAASPENRSEGQAIPMRQVSQEKS